MLFVLIVLYVRYSNEYYVKDGSKKVRASLKLKGESGEHLTTIPPYGYVKDPDNPKKWVVDSKAAEVVKRIFALCMDGYGPTQIARILKAEQVVTPTVYQDRQNQKVRNALPASPYDWNGSSVSGILERIEYCGHTANFRTHKKPSLMKKLSSACRSFSKKGTDYCGTHFIRAAVLEEGVLLYLQRLLWYISEYEDLFREKLGVKCKEESKKELTAKRRQLTQAQRRIDEIDQLFKRIYEDMVSGKITESRFDKLSEDYEAEQAEIAKKIEALESEISQQEEDAESIEEFIRRAKKYPVLNELTPTVLNDLVNRVYVCAPDKSSGHRVQEVRISLNLIGFLPESFISEMLSYQSK